MAFTVAEDVQLMLTRQPGRIEFDQVIPVAGALIELTLLGRLSSVEKKGFFVDPVGRLLVVIDPAPTGQQILDTALAAIVEHGKPWRVDRAIVAIRLAVVSAVHEALESRGLVRATGKPNDSRGYLEIVDSDGVETRRSVLRRARTLPDTVEDPRLGAVVDLLRSGGNLYRGETGLHERITRDWYPAEATFTIDAILRAEGYLKESL